MARKQLHGNTAANLCMIHIYEPNTIIAFYLLIHTDISALDAEKNQSQVYVKHGCDWSPDSASAVHKVSIVTAYVIACVTSG